MSILKNNYPLQANSRRIPRVKNTTDDGTDTGSPYLNINASSGPIDFWYQPPVNTEFTLLEIIMELSDVGNSEFSDYGSISGPITNGVKFFIENNGIERPLGVNFHSNSDLMRIVGNLEFLTFSANIRILTFKEKIHEYSDGLVLNGDTNDKFIIRINDNFSSLSRHLCILKGYTRGLDGLKNLNA